MDLRCSVFVATLGLSVAAQAAPIVSSFHNQEVQRRSSTGAYTVGQAQPNTGFRVGYQANFQPTTTTPGGIATLYYFQLPSLPAGQQVSTATFSVSELKASAGVTPTFGVDLYGAGYETGDPFAIDNPQSGYGSAGVTSNTVSQTYFYTGPDQVGATGAGGQPIQKLVDDLFTGSDFTAANAAGSISKTTDASTNSALANYVQSIYDAGNQAGGGYLILRLTPDALTDTNLGTMRYQFPYAPDTEPGAGTGPTYDPATYGNVTVPQINLAFEPVPEPAALSLLSLGFLGLMRRRRSR